MAAYGRHSMHLVDNGQSDRNLRFEREVSTAKRDSGAAAKIPAGFRPRSNMQRDEFKTRLRKCSPTDLVELIELSGNTTHSARARKRTDEQNRDFLLRSIYDN